MASVERHGRAAEPRASALVCALLVVGACSVRGPVPEASLSSNLAALGGGAAVAVQNWPARELPETLLQGIDGVVVASQGWRQSDLPTSSPALAQLRQYVEKGGRVLLLGYAVALCKELGVDGRRPDVVEPFRWGFDARTALGRAALGFELVSGRLPELSDGLEAATGFEHGYLVQQGEPLCTPLCAFATIKPEHGEVLGRLLRRCDDRTQVLDAAVLVRWRLGNGEVLGLGLEPQLDASDATTAKNGRALATAAIRWLGGDRAPRRLECLLLPEATATALPTRLQPVGDRDVPGASQLAHWGIVAAVHEQAPARTPEQVLGDVLLPSWAAGADALSLDLVDKDHGLPLPWGERDPIARPKSYSGSGFARGWAGEGMERLQQEAHARGLIVQALLDPPPGGDDAPSRLAALRYLARQWADLRRLGDRALDGVAVRRWFRDDRGLGVQMLQDFQPGGHVLRLGESVPVLSGASAGIDARDGRLVGARAAGLAAGFRDGFPGDLYPAGYLDCATRRPWLLPGEGDRQGGGAFGDWIAQQALDFVRARRGTGGAMFWDAYAVSTLDATTLRYVHGVSQEPLVAAVAARLTATGEGGWRAAQRQLLGEAQAGFGATVAAPAATVMLTNNHLRLLGSGGALLYDGGGLGRFDGPAAVRLCEPFFRTRFYGGRPDADELRAPVVDLLAGGRRGDGGYAPAFAAVAAGAIPGTLAFGAAPRWPQRVDLPFGDDVGMFELELAARGVSGEGVLAVGLDDAVLALLPFADGRLPIATKLPVQVARAGHRSLRLEVLDGGAVTLDKIVVRRSGDLGAEADVLQPAGALATVRERSASTYHSEVVELTTIADQSAIVLRTQCERAVRSLQQERRFGFRGYTDVQSGAAEDRSELQRPFVLQSGDASLPDVAIVPLQLSRYEHFAFDGTDLVLKNHPEPGTGSLIGFMLLPHGEGPAALPHLPTVFAAFDRPLALALGDAGTAELRSDLPIAYPRVLALTQPARTPFLVKERGWWTWRGTQATDDPKTSWLRVVQLPGDAVQIVGGQSLLVRTRPGPGAVHTVALKDVTATAATVRVLQTSPLSTPCVVMGEDFDAVTLDGKPWSFWRDRTVFVPDRVGTYRIETRRHGGDVEPHVLASSAVFEHCAWDPATKELVLVVAADRSRPPELPFTAIVSGPRPTSVDGGAVVDEKDMRHQDAGARAAAERVGTTIRFRPGIVRVRHGS